MKISWHEVRDLEDYIQRLEDETETSYQMSDGEVALWSYFADNPHFLLAMGFDEYVAFQNHVQFKHLWFSDDVEPEVPQSLFRMPSGQWYLTWGGPSDRRGEITFHTKDNQILTNITDISPIGNGTLLLFKTSTNRGIQYHVLATENISKIRVN